MSRRVETRTFEYDEQGRIVKETVVIDDTPVTVVPNYVRPYQPYQPYWQYTPNVTYTINTRGKHQRPDDGPAGVSARV